MVFSSFLARGVSGGATCSAVSCSSSWRHLGQTASLAPLLAVLFALLVLGDRDLLINRAGVDLSGNAQSPAADLPNLPARVVHHEQLPSAVRIRAVECAEGQAPVGSGRRRGKGVPLAACRVEIGWLEDPIGELGLGQ